VTLMANRVARFTQSESQNHTSWESCSSEQSCEASAEAVALISFTFSMRVTLPWNDCSAQVTGAGPSEPDVDDRGLHMFALLPSWPTATSCD
jgi:hypothetical protein